MAKKDSIFGAEPDRLKQLIRSGMDVEEIDIEDPPVASDRVAKVMERPGTQIGCYKLLKVLGEGGMGVVYLAEQEQLIRRRVALKIIKPGMDSKRVLARFEAERQALALLDHPNIAQVHDAGTADSGRPYFVMEYVKGTPITEFCDRHSLTIEQRLRLFQQVCAALQHAHQKGIIHRDIKPSNILVVSENDQATPKIIDFGVAKAIVQPLTERTLVTEENHLLGTPEYMSPEQVEYANEDIDTRSDIYSLGVLLYELLTGVLPFDSDTLRTGGVEHIRKVIRETDPKTPSTRLAKLGEEAAAIAQNRRMEIQRLAKHLRRELEWIPLKAMRKERSQRYRSASDLSDDIENYLKGDPLMAGPPTAKYRLNKFIGRHKALVSGIAAVLIVSIVGTIVSVSFALGQARALSESKLVTDYLYQGILRQISNQRNRELTAHDILDTAVENLGKKFNAGTFEDYPLAEARIRRRLGDAYLWGIWDYDAAVEQYERSRRINQEHLGVKPDGSNSLGMAYREQGRYEEAAEQLEAVVERIRRSGQVKQWHSLMWGNLASVFIEQGRYEEAEQLEIESLTRHFEDGSDMSSVKLAEIYRLQGRYEEAEPIFIEKVDRTKGDPNSRNFWYSRCGLGRLLTAQGRYEDANDLLVEVWERACEDNREEALGTLYCIHCLAVLRREQGQYEEAETLFLKALDGRRRKLGPDHPHTLQSMHELAVLQVKQDQHQQAADLLVKVAEARLDKLGDKHPHTQGSVALLIDLYKTMAQPEKAERWLAKLPADGTTDGQPRNASRR